MARLMHSQNRIGFFFESGLYAQPSGAAATMQWLGMVQSHSADEEKNRAPTRYVGGGDRNVQQFVDGAEDYTGTFSYFPQDFRMLGFALGSMRDTWTGSPAEPKEHFLSESEANETNAFTSGTKAPFMSFTMYDAKRFNPTGLNFIRAYHGCTVDTFTLTGARGEILTAEVGYIAQNTRYTSGTASGVTENSNIPYQWSDVQMHLPSGAAATNTIFNDLTDFSFSVNNNLIAPHYCNGSTVIDAPLPDNRDYELTMTVDSEIGAANNWVKTLYDKYFDGGSTFNMMLQVKKPNSTSGALWLIMSGCEITDMENPTEMEGPVEQSITIQPKFCSAEANDTTELYNPW